MYLGMSELYCEWNDLNAATQNLLRSRELGEHMGFPQNPYRWRVAMARIREAEGDLESTLALLDEAARRYTSDFGPNVSVGDELSYVREFEHITLARLLLAGDSGVESLAVLECAPARGRRGRQDRDKRTHGGGLNTSIRSADRTFSMVCWPTWRAWRDPSSSAARTRSGWLSY
jgi:hypothetical protein